MLCVHLKRFRHDLSYSSKISSPVHFPLVGLDMRPYLHKECKSEVSTYDLTAVICHHGTVGGGHYTSFAKHELTGKWFEFDDQLVTEVSAEVVQNCEAYVLFYRKSNPQMSVIRSQAMQLDDMGAEQASDIRFFVSRQWLNKFKTFAEPGPIDNWALLCPHGGLSPRKASIASRLVVALPQPLWEFLFKKFGGGPACNHLFECDICRQAADSLARRQNYELDAFSAYKDETTSTIYAISMAWFRQWQLFVVGAVTDEDPGPIDNKTIASQSDVPISRGVKPGADYAQINSTLWKFFYNIYGGGPEIILRGNPNDEFRPMSIPTPAPINKEREERIIEPPPPVVNDYASSMQQDHQPPQTMTINADVERPPSIQIPPAPTPAVPAQPVQSDGIAKKIPKNVSFEGDDNSDKEISSAPSSIVSSELSSSIRRGSKHQHALSTVLSEIVSKKDRRHRGGIKTNGLFGAEGKHFPLHRVRDYPHFSHFTFVEFAGKYSDFKHIPDDNGVPLRNSPKINGGGGGGDVMTDADANKRLEEITPLMHQASISATSHEPTAMHTNSDAITMNGSARTVEPSTMHHKSSSSSSKSHHHHSSTVYRKRFKTKSGRKLPSYNVSENNLSDSDRN